MTPKERAVDILSKVTEQLLDSGFRISKNDVKKVSFVCVDEIINLLFGKDLNGTIPESITDFWNEVKSEIEKL